MFTRLFITSLALLLGSSATHAQDARIKTKIKEHVSKPWVVKWAPAGLVFGKLGLGAEYNYRRKRSVTFNIGIPINHRYEQLHNHNNYILANKTFSAMGGYRMYFAKKPMRGFYFEPYLKYVDYKGNGQMLYENPNVYSYNVDAHYTGFGAGAQLGVQFMIAKIVTFDFFILGPEANAAKFTSTFTDVKGTIGPWNDAKAQQDIEDILSDIPVIGKKVEITSNSAAHQVSAQYKGFLPGIRFGASIGIHF